MGNITLDFDYIMVKKKPFYSSKYSNGVNKVDIKKILTSDRV